MNLVKRLFSKFGPNLSIVNKAAGTNIVSRGSYGSITTAGEGCKLISATFAGDISLGRYVSIWGPNIKIMAKINPISIGSFCSIALNTVIINYNHNYKGPTTYPILKNVFGESVLADIHSSGPIQISEDVWVGASSVILGGVTIGRGSIVSAGSVVTRDIPPYSIVGGVPAKIIKRRFSDKVIEQLEESKWWEWSTETIKKNKDFFNQKFD